MYKSASGSSLSNGHLKQIPAGGANFGRQVVQSTAPAARVIQPRADSVMVNKIGLYSFQYDNPHGLAVNAASADQSLYVTGSNLIDQDQGPITLPIQPIAWHRIDETAEGDVGDVIFIYRGRPE